MFKFKQFSIKQDQTAMKVGTDGVLIGAWTNAKNPNYILDIGSGTGLVSLMLAQKYPLSKIHAVEIEKYASLEANDNFKDSKWSKNLTIFNEDFLDFAEKTKIKYDLIVSNPPFFENSLKGKEKNRQIARHNNLLPFDNLAKKIKKLISEKGKFCVIIPFENHIEFIHKFEKELIICNQITYIKHNTNKPIKRVIIEFSKKITFVKKNELYIKVKDDYSSKYKNLTKDYYLFFS